MTKKQLGVVALGGRMGGLLFLMLTVVAFFLLRGHDFFAIWTVLAIIIAVLDCIMPSYFGSQLGSFPNEAPRLTALDIFQKLLPSKADPKHQKVIDDLLEHKDFALATQLLLFEIQGKNPSNAQFQQAIGIFLQVGQVEKAMELTEKRVQIFGATVGDYLTISQLQWKQLRLDLAVKTLEKALVLSPHDYLVLNNIGFYKSMLGDQLGAIVHLQTCIQLKPTMAFAHNNLGYAKIMQGFLEEGKLNVLKSLELDSQNPGSFCSMGAYHFAKGEFEEAVKYLELAVSLNDNELRYQTDLDKANAELIAQSFTAKSI